MKLLAFLKVIALGKRNESTEQSVQSPYLQAENLDLLGRRLDAVRIAYWKCTHNGNTDWANLYLQIEAELQRRWTSAMAFYSNPRNSQIVR